MIRLAQLLGAAPDKIRGKESAQISNQRPISEKAARDFSDDIRRFVRSYAAVIPRHAFIDTLEACIATGMTSILTSTVEILLEWTETGEITKRQQQQPAGIFVDCSHGVDGRSRALAERSLDDLMRRIERIPAILMMLRILDYAARDNREIRKKKLSTRPLRHGMARVARFSPTQASRGSVVYSPANGGLRREACRGIERGLPGCRGRHYATSKASVTRVRRLALALTPLLGATGAEAHHLGG